ncbi:hypothetical protein CTZ27_24975 [Streptomyces griseocarneus]|nr:hypothetical protein CTZ27_24975 [Streptomyces griseocarneus]
MEEAEEITYHLGLFLGDAASQPHTTIQHSMDKLRKHISEVLAPKVRNTARELLPEGDPRREMCVEAANEATWRALRNGPGVSPDSFFPYVKSLAQSVKDLRELETALERHRRHPAGAETMQARQEPAAST